MERMVGEALHAEVEVHEQAARVFDGAAEYWTRLGDPVRAALAIRSAELERAAARKAAGGRT